MNQYGPLGGRSETVELQGQPWSGVFANWVRVTGYNTPALTVAIK